MTANGLLEKGIITIIAMLCIAIPILDFIGALDKVPWISNRISIYILLSQGSMMMYLLLYAHKSEVGQKRGREQIQHSIEQLVQDDIITDNVRMQWEQNQSEIERIFNLVSDRASKSTNKIEVFLDEIYHDIVSGKSFPNSRFAWDMTVGALDYNFQFVYHPTRKGGKLLDDTREQQHKELVNKREPKLKSFIWANSLISEQFAHIYKDTLPTHMRLTKIYYQDLPKRNVVVFVESHINLLSRLPQVNDLKVEDVRKYLRGF